MTANLVEWLANGERGISSECIVSTLTGIRIRSYFGNHPHDTADLRRCFILLRQCPELRPRIGEMAQVSPEWKAFAEAWDELEACYLGEMGDFEWWNPNIPRRWKEAPKTSKMVRRILESARKLAVQP